MKLRLIAGLLIVISSVVSAQAQTEPVQTESGVARVSLIHGDVSTQRGDSGDWATAALNAPIVAGDRVSTGDRSRAEVQLDYASILRLDERTQANITGLSRTQIQIQLARGLANYSVLKDSEADVEIDAPNLSVHPRRGDGSYRITVFSDDRAEVLVRKGEADISTPQGSTHVRSGQLITVRGTGNDTRYQVADAPSRDDFDRWTNDRDNTIRNAQSWSRTNRYYVGSEDLDTYGRWTNVPDYGQVWVPVVASGWAPYRAGRWVWEPYWGWTWVSYEPWGWAPYHYGRWFMYGNSWVWWPGQSYGYRHYRPIWAPAYVSFFGFGHGGGVGFSFGGGFGSVGWLPIGPCDGFYPWWGGYRSRFNVVNIYNVHNVYNYHNGGIAPLRSGNRYSNLRLAASNDRVRHAISTVPSNDFGRGRFSAQPVSREQFRDGKMVAGNLPVVPTRASLLAGDRRAAPPIVGRGGQPERFFTNNRNRPVSTPQSFDREAADVHNAIQRDGRFTPIVGNQRSTAGEGNPRTVPQGRTTDNREVTKPNAGLPANGSSQGSTPGSNQTWRRSGPTGQPANVPGGAAGLSTPGQPSGGRNQDWMRTPSSGATQRPAGNGIPNNSGQAGQPSSPGQRRQSGGDTQDWRRGQSSGSQSGPTGNASPTNNGPGGHVNAPVDRRAPTAAPQENREWRSVERSSQTAPRSISGSTEAPASRDRFQREDSSPTQGRGNDWQRMPPTQSSTTVDSGPSHRSAPPAQRDSGNWRQSAPRDSGREVSRPPLDIRQPIVTTRSSGPAPSAGYRGNGGGGGDNSRPAPSKGGGGGHSTPNRGGWGGVGQHSSVGNGGPHRGR